MRQTLTALSLLFLLAQVALADPAAPPAGKDRPRVARGARKAASSPATVDSGQAAAQARVERLEVARARATLDAEARDRVAERRGLRSDQGRPRPRPEADRFEEMKDRQDQRVERREARKERRHHPVP